MSEGFRASKLRRFLLPAVLHGLLAALDAILPRNCDSKQMSGILDDVAQTHYFASTKAADVTASASAERSFMMAVISMRSLLLLCPTLLLYIGRGKQHDTPASQ